MKFSLDKDHLAMSYLTELFSPTSILYHLTYGKISMLAGKMSQKYDVFDPEEGVCRNAVVIIGTV